MIVSTMKINQAVEEFPGLRETLADTGVSVEDCTFAEAAEQRNLDLESFMLLLNRMLTKTKTSCLCESCSKKRECL